METLRPSNTLCLNDPPQCLSVSPGNFSSSWTNYTLPTPWCRGNQLVNNWWYNYRTCKPPNSMRYFIAERSLLVCQCVDGPFQCRVYHKDGTCRVMILSTIFIQLTMALVAFVMNSIIVINFLKHSLHVVITTPINPILQCPTPRSPFQQWTKGIRQTFTLISL